MAKLYFKYGAMGSSKTAQALITKYNYEENDMQVWLIKPSADTRDGADIMRSRIGLQARAEVMTPDMDIYQCFQNSCAKNCHVVIVDECQFMTPTQIDQLRAIVDDYDIPVICYGLRTDFRGELFEGSRELLCWADTIEEIKTICWCGRKATFNARVHNGKIVREGEQILLGGNSTYISLCRRHWKSGELGDAPNLND